MFSKMPEEGLLYSLKQAIDFLDNLPRGGDIPVCSIDVTSTPFRIPADVARSAVEARIDAINAELTKRSTT
jgi:hypothetical protein